VKVITKTKLGVTAQPTNPIEFLLARTAPDPLAGNLVGINIYEFISA